MLPSGPSLTLYRYTHDVMHFRLAGFQKGPIRGEILSGFSHAELKTGGSARGTGGIQEDRGPSGLPPGDELQ